MSMTEPRTAAELFQRHKERQARFFPRRIIMRPPEPAKQPLKPFPGFEPPYLPQDLSLRTLQGFVRLACRRYRLELADFCSRRRSGDITAARDEVMFRLVELGLGVKTIGRIISCDPHGVKDGAERARKRLRSRPQK